MSKKDFFVKKTSILQSRHEGVRMLIVEENGTSNFAKWKEEIQLYLLQTHSYFEEIIEFSRHHVFARPVIEDVIFSKKEVEVLKSSSSSEKVTTKYDDVDRGIFNQLLKKYVDRILKYTDDAIVVYGIIFSTLSEEAKDRTRSHDDFVDANSAKDPLMLYNIIKAVHMGSTGIVAELEMETRRQHYSNLRMMSNETVMVIRTDSGMHSNQWRLWALRSRQNLRWQLIFCRLWIRGALVDCR